jgi:hypothetical protein
MSSMTSGQAAAAPPSSVMNSRRCNQSMRFQGLTLSKRHLKAALASLSYFGRCQSPLGKIEADTGLSQQAENRFYDCIECAGVEEAITGCCCHSRLQTFYMNVCAAAHGIVAGQLTGSVVGLAHDLLPSKTPGRGRVPSIRTRHVECRSRRCGTRTRGRGHFGHRSPLPTRYP